MNLGKKIKAVRIAEEMNQDEMANLLDIPVGTLRNCEQGRNELKSETLTRITGNLRFEKYAFWLMTGKVLPESGQICPDFSIQERCGIISKMQMAKRA